MNIQEQRKCVIHPYIFDRLFPKRPFKDNNLDVNSMSIKESLELPLALK